jgi:hypothetical protein
MLNNRSQHNKADTLHTDLLERSYGPVHAEVMRHDALVREVKMLDKLGRLRTYAVTFFAYDKNDAGIKAVDAEIERGGLIGKTFHAHGYATRRNVIGTFMMPITAILRKAFHTTLAILPARVVEFFVSKNDGPFSLYGTIVEVGGFTQPPALKEISVVAMWHRRAAKWLRLSF